MAKEDKFDIAVIGAGPAGIMAAGVAASIGLRVALIEKNSTLGKKLLLTGNGRCNLTNLELNLRELVKNYHNGEFLFHAFSIFGPKETINFFESIGIKTKAEKNRKVFPISNSAREVLEALKKYLIENKVKIFNGSEVVDVTCDNKKIKKIVLKEGEITAKKYILTTGGKSYPSTGSNGFGYKLAEKLGHTIINPKPALSPIKLKEEWAKDLQAVSLKDIRITALQNGKKKFSENGEIIFTHFGISGPSALNISGAIEDLMSKGNTKISIDMFPALNQEEVAKSFEEILKKYPKQIIKNILSEIVPEKLAYVLLSITGIDKDKIANNLPKAEREKIIRILKNFEMKPEDVLGFDGAMVTKGGICLKEINHKTMQSKIIDNLFFAGEIIDVNGKTGGFNLQMCWSTGYIAGQNCK